MSEHTPGPLSLDIGAAVVMAGQIVITAPGPDGASHKERQANAARIVACWNALQDVPTDWLEQAAAYGITDVSIGNLFSSRLALKRRNAELMESLSAAIHALRSYQHGNGAPDLAKSIADAAEKTIANGEPHADYAS